MGRKRSNATLARGAQPVNNGLGNTERAPWCAVEFAAPYRSGSVFHQPKVERVRPAFGGAG